MWSPSWSCRLGPAARSRGLFHSPIVTRSCSRLACRGSWHAREEQLAIAALLSLAGAAGYACGGHTAIATWLVLITIPLNIYPVALQRRNRGRAVQLRRRLAAARRPGLSPSDDQFS